MSGDFGALTDEYSSLLSTGFTFSGWCSKLFWSVTSITVPSTKVERVVEGLTKIMGLTTVLPEWTVLTSDALEVKTGFGVGGGGVYDASLCALLNLLLICVEFTCGVNSTRGVLSGVSLKLSCLGIDNLASVEHPGVGTPTDGVLFI